MKKETADAYKKIKDRKKVEHATKVIPNKKKEEQNKRIKINPNK